MKTKITLTSLLLFVLQFGFAQMQPFGNLTIFSEDGDKFFLVLNGEKINDVAQANLRVEELTQPYYNAKIIFEDETRTPISKNYLQIADEDVFMDVTYKIKRDRNNAKKMKLNYFSMIPVERGYIPPSNVYVTHYGDPTPRPHGSVTQTTTTTTSTGGVSAGIQMNGVGVNVTVNDPMLSTTVTETNTTTTSSSHGNHNTHETVGCSNAYPMSQSNFNSALQTIQKLNFDETKLKTAKQIASSNCLSAGQIVAICKTFGFEESKLDFAKFAYKACTEANNYFKVNDVFSFSSSVDELTEYTSGR
ncbi:MAG: DUF4476 domain-containing protein [Flavobacterium sp.]|nr:MAG: DUF4476 domain-containing protein [Flavobacterium sp.]